MRIALQVSDFTLLIWFFKNVSICILSTAHLDDFAAHHASILFGESCWRVMGVPSPGREVP
jgi:hypothetical protein